MFNFIKSFIKRSKQEKLIKEQIDKCIVKHMEVWWGISNPYSDEFYENFPELPRYGFWTYTCSNGKTIFVEGDFKPIILLQLEGYYEEVRADVINTYLPHLKYILK